MALKKVRELFTYTPIFFHAVKTQVCGAENKQLGNEIEDLCGPVIQYQSEIKVVMIQCNLPDSMNGV